MRKKTQITAEKNHADIQYEDAALKVSMQFFADELLPYLGIPGKVISFAPTELVYLEIQKLFQDFNLVMEDGSWKHFEFQSTNEGRNGLKRFRTYEAVTSYQYKVSITTYVLFSGSIRKPMTEYTEGINTYRVVPIIMQDQNVNDFFARLWNKVNTGEALTRQDLVPMTLCPLMGGEMPQKERIKAAYEITRKADGVDPEDIQRIEAVIYTMAEKFLQSMDFEEIMEGVRMTRLGTMLKNEGREEEKMKNARNLLDILDERLIAERLEIPLETVQKLKKEKETL